MIIQTGLFRAHRLGRRFLHQVPGALITATMAMLLVVSCSNQGSGADAPDKEKDKDSAADEAVPVEVETLGTGSMESILRFSANLEAESQVQVLARTAGLVRRLPVEEGDEVRSGKTLLQLEDEEQRSQLDRARNDVAHARREFAQQDKLHERGLVSDQILQNAEYEKTRLELLERDASRSLRYTVVRAPIGGTITQRLVKRGDHVNPQQPLFEITDFDSLVALVYVPEKELNKLTPGLVARISPPSVSDDVYSGEIKRISPTVDARSGTLKVTVDVPRAPNLLPGMFVEVELVTDVRDDAILLPKRALVYDNEVAYAFKVGADGIAERVRIEPVLENRHFVFPAQGFAAGDTVVTAGQVGLKHGAKVAAKPAAQAASASSDDGGSKGEASTADSGEGAAKSGADSASDSAAEPAAQPANQPAKGDKTGPRSQTKVQTASRSHAS